MNLKRAFAILELDKAGSFTEVKQSYRDLTAIWHPDRYSHNARLANKATDKMKEINAAYSYLSDHFFNLNEKPPQKPGRAKYIKAGFGIALIAASFIRKKSVPKVRGGPRSTSP